MKIGQSRDKQFESSNYLVSTKADNVIANKKNKFHWIIFFFRPFTLRRRETIITHTKEKEVEVEDLK